MRINSLLPFLDDNTLFELLDREIGGSIKHIIKDIFINIIGAVLISTLHPRLLINNLLKEPVRPL